MFTLEPLTLFDGGFGPVMVPVSAADGKPAPRDKPILPKDMGKAPGILTEDGWIPRDLRREFFVARDHVPRFLQSGGNVGLRGGLPLGIMWFDNDQGEAFSDIVQEVMARFNITPLRRYVDHPKHKHDAFLLCLTDMVGPVEVANRQCEFRKGVEVGKFQILGQGKHAVAWGVHSGTRKPYVWNRNVVTIEDVPCIHVADWCKMYANVIEEIEGAGWKLESGQRTVPAQAPSAHATPNAMQASNTVSYSIPYSFTDLQGLSGTYQEVRAALLLLPNDPEKASKALNRYLDLYKHYIDVCYMIVGALGATKEARELWLWWAHQRPQTPNDNPETVWASAARQPQIHLGMKQIVQLVQEYGNGALWAQFMFTFAPDVDDDPADPVTTVTQTILDRWAYAYKPDCYVNLVTDELVTRSAFNALLATSVPDLYVAVKGTGMRKRSKPPRASDLFDLLPNRHVVRNFTYAPGDAMFAPTPAGEFDANSWRASTHGVTPGVTETQIMPWLDHIEMVLGSRVERDRFLRWCAYQVQFPRGKSNWHWLVMSPEGYGKDTMFDPVALAVGPDNFIDVSVHDMSREFNHYLQKKLILINETMQVNTVGMNAHNFYSKLKRMLSSPPNEMTVNLKNRQEFQLPNRQAFFMFSNEKNPIWLAEGQRRIHVIDRTKETVPPPGYFDALTRQLKGGMGELVASYLRSYSLPADIDNEMRGVAPSTFAKSKLQAMNRDPIRVVLEEIVEDARNGAVLHTLLAETHEIMDLIKGRTNINASPHMLNRHLSDMDGVQPLVPPPEGRIGPGYAATTIKGKVISGRLWRLGDKTADGFDLTQQSKATLLLYHRDGVPPKSATVTPLVKAKLAQTPDDVSEPDEAV